jgi:hypothetical protein
VTCVGCRNYVWGGERWVCALNYHRNDAPCPLFTPPDYDELEELVDADLHVTLYPPGTRIPGT